MVSQSLSFAPLNWIGNPWVDLEVITEQPSSQCFRAGCLWTPKVHLVMLALHWVRELELATHSWVLHSECRSQMFKLKTLLHELHRLSHIFLAAVNGKLAQKLRSKKKKKQQQKQAPWASLVAQWLRVCLPMQGTRVRALVWEDPTCHRATGPVSHSY